MKPKATVLKKEIGLFSATAIGIGTIIGAGIFVVTGIVAGLAGPAIIISMIIAGIIAILNALSFSELSAFLPKEGGVYIFAHELISSNAGFIAGWMWVFSNIFVGAAVSLGFAHYVVAISQTLPAKLIAVIICLVFIVLNYLGVRKTAILNNLLVSTKLFILTFFVALGVGYFNGSYFTPFIPTGSFGILQGSALIFFAYTGFARITTMAEEVKDPSRTIPRSIILALVTSTVIYLFVSLTAVGLVGYNDLSSTGSPLVEAIKVTGSQAAVSLIAMGAMVATTSVLLTTILGVSRVTFAMARNDDFPKFLSKIHPKYETPYYAIWITGLLMILAIIFADLTRVVTVSTFASLIYYLIANLAALRLREKVRRYSLFVPVISLLSCLGLLMFLTFDSWIIGVIAIGIGIVYYKAYKKFRLRFNSRLNLS
jgi:APA family basic amino acid/polyamine antiporter